MKKVSVIIPIYNVSKYLRKCLISVLNQEFQEYEVILVDDGSTDDSGEIAVEFAKKYPYLFRYVRQENNGISSARNKGIDLAIGKYLCFVDSDDYIESTFVKQMYDMAESNDADLVFCALASVDESGKYLKKIYESNLTPGKKYSIYDAPELLLIQNAACNKLFKREIIQKENLRFEQGVWYEDMRFVKKYLLFVSSGMYCDAVLYNYVKRSGSIMNSMNTKRNMEILDAMNDIESYYKEKKQYERFKNELEFLAIEHVYISTLVRFIRANIRNEHFEIIRETFLNKYPGFRNNPYLFNLDKKRKVLVSLLNYKLYSIIYWLFKIKEFLA